MKISFKFSEPDGRLFPLLTKGAARAVWYSHHPPLCGGHDQSGPVSVCVDTGVPTGQSPPSLRVQVSKPCPGLVRYWSGIMEKVFFYYSLYQIDDMNWREIEGGMLLLICILFTKCMVCIYMHYYFTVMTVWVMNTHSHSKLSKKMVFLVHGVHGTGTYF